MIFQEPMTSLNPVLTIGRQLTETLELHLDMTRSQAMDRARELLDMVGIPDSRQRLRDYPHQLSGGQRQRVMIAIALSCNPKLLIADEATTALDVTIQAQILELMKDLTERLGTALLIITHNLGVVARYADRVNVMYAGRIREMGVADDIYGTPKHPYTVGLLNSVPRLDRELGERLLPIRGEIPDPQNLPPGCAFMPRCEWAVDHCALQDPPLLDVKAPAPPVGAVPTQKLDVMTVAADGVSGSSSAPAGTPRSYRGANPAHRAACWEHERVGIREGARN
jgi:oligopeptide/dipeptide ABC transporter ATP-binding protein